MASYIDLTVGFSGWGFDENGEFYSKIEELGYHSCSEAELGLKNNAEDDAAQAKGREMSPFYPIIDENRKADMNYHKSKFFCFDTPEALSINGDYNSATAKLLYI